MKSGTKKLPGHVRACATRCTDYSAGSFLSSTGRNSIRAGDTFGRLLVESIYCARWPSGGSYRRAVCKCTCGTITDVTSATLRQGTTKSCGCLQVAMHTSHGMSRTTEYRTWDSMRQRCNNPNFYQYRHYGGRGIEVCHEWQDSFETFYRDMGPKPGASHSIDRINVNGNYEPGNCRWATKKEQSLNRRKPIEDSDISYMLDNEMISQEDANAARRVLKNYHKLSAIVRYQK